MLIELQDEEALLDDVDLRAGEDQLHDAMTGSQNHDTSEFDFQIDHHMYSPTPEAGPSRASHYCEVFNVKPQSESKSEEEIEQDEGTYEDEDTHVWFQPDTAPESEDADNNEEIHAVCFEDPMIVQGEEAHQLDIQWELDDLGLSILSVVTRDNIKAMAFKIGNQLTQNTFKGVQKLTHGHLAIKTEYVASRILECTSGLSAQVYDCCVNTCICYTGEFASHTTCPLCGELRVDKQNKAQN